MALLAAFAVAGCASPPMRPSSYHLGTTALPDSGATDPVQGQKDPVPSIVTGPAMPPLPQNGPKLETYSVVVSDVEIGRASCRERV